MIIFHVDLDCFFAAVEVLDHPEYQGVPLIVGADPKKGKGRGVVSTCSYEARDYGVHSGMPISRAYQLCPFGVYVRPNFSRISEISHQVMDILQSHCKIFEQTSIDEAYLDMTDLVANFDQAKAFAAQIQEQIHVNTGITCSIGVSFSKTLAKIGSDLNKPNGIAIITPENYQKLLVNLPLTRIPGIGKKTKHYYESRGFYTFHDIYSMQLAGIIRKLGEHGKWVYDAAHGSDGRHVHDSRLAYDPKSISKERTFREDTSDFDFVFAKIEDMNEKLHRSLEKRNLLYRTITLKIRFQGFITYTRSQSLGSPTCSQKTAVEVLRGLMAEFINSPKKIRLVGVKFSNFTKSQKKNQLKLTDFLEKTAK